ncbi:MAG: MFS transporter [Paracoccaceae bacterium]
MEQVRSVAARPQTHMAVLLALSATHLLNDLIQSLIPAIYPIIKDAYALDFVQIGMITLTFQIAASLFQPVVGHVTDRHPMPYASVVGMMFSLAGLLGLGFATSYGFILVSAACVGIGSSIFHPEATRMVRMASGGRQGLAQGLFQIGGQAGGALGPLAAALIIVPKGQTSLAWFALAALLAVILMVWTARQMAALHRRLAASRGAGAGAHAVHPRATVLWGLAVLTLLMFSKNTYVESFRSFYTFYLIERFDVSIPVSQLMLFVFLLAAAAGALIGGILGDRIGRYRIIWISVLGPLPLTLLLPHVDFFWTGVLTVLINLIMSSAFASILIYAMELAPGRIGLIGGLFYGLNFGLAGIAAAVLGGMADSVGIEAVYHLCAFLPLAGLLAWFLPRIDEGHAPAVAGIKQAEDAPG